MDSTAGSFFYRLRGERIWLSEFYWKGKTRENEKSRTRWGEGKG